VNPARALVESPRSVHVGRDFAIYDGARLAVEDGGGRLTIGDGGWADRLCAAGGRRTLGAHRVDLRAAGLASQWAEAS
jgi:hypothetical protein